MTALPGNRPQVHGHRGSPLRFPENTIPSFLDAIKAGADFIELDLQASQDNVLVVSHDPVLDGQRIRSLSAAEITSCPRFTEVLKLAERFPRIGLNVEIKSYPGRLDLGPAPEVLAELVLNEIGGRNFGERLLIQSFDFRVLHEVRKRATGIEISALWEGERRACREIASEAGSSTVSLYYAGVDRFLVDEGRAAGIRVLVWTANGPESWLKMISAGVDGIITDDPAELIAFLNSPNA